MSKPRDWRFDQKIDIKERLRIIASWKKTGFPCLECTFGFEHNDCYGWGCTYNNYYVWWMKNIYEKQGLS
jgi:hypothetical protein